MNSEYSKEEILIIIKTYPEYSTKHTETVCTGGVLKSSRKLIRIYPIRFRYIDGDVQFKKYQWVTAKIKKAITDTRPESYRIDEDSIQLGAVIGTQDQWQEREKWLLAPQNVYNSLEDLKNSEREKGTSLGLIKPKKILKFRIENKSEQEINDANLRKKKIMDQLGMFEDKKDLELMPVRFKLKFECDNHDCKQHELSILDWEIAELYRKLKRMKAKDWKAKLENKILTDLCGLKKSTHLILGNMASRHHIFCICGFFYPPVHRQQQLFDL